jgi:CTD small phosphatase-like protein 2
VFTASHECYANVVLDHLDGKKDLISHRLFRNHCWQTEEGVYIKDLRVLKNRNLSNILLVDNAAYSYFYQLENGIPIIPFYDDKDDNELVQLIEYLRAIIKLKQSQEKSSLQDLNHDYFQLGHYSSYQTIEELTNKLYRQSISKYKAIIH